MSRNDYAEKRDKRNEQKSRRSKETNASGETADWTNAEPTLVVQAIAIVAYHGGALRFGYTRDGGAYCIGILGDGEPYNEYTKPNEDINTALSDLIRRWTD